MLGEGWVSGSECLIRSARVPCLHLQPSSEHPSLLLCATPEASGPVAGVLRKKTLLAVVQTLGGVWWRVRWHNREAWYAPSRPSLLYVQIIDGHAYRVWAARTRQLCFA